MGKDPHESRPDLCAVTAADDVTGWYWTRTELVQIARNHGVTTQGSKAELQKRIAATLSGGTPEPAGPPPRGSGRLVPPFAPGMSVPAGQPVTRELRQWMSGQLGREVRVTQQIRDFMRNPQGRTLRDLLVLAEQPSEPGAISQQFELNRFMRIMKTQQPNLTHAERMAAWREFRQRPTAARARVLNGEEPWQSLS
jgi:hypothetical protein